VLSITSHCSQIASVQLYQDRLVRCNWVRSGPYWSAGMATGDPFPPKLRSSWSEFVCFIGRTSVGLWGRHYGQRPHSYMKYSPGIDLTGSHPQAPYAYLILTIWEVPPPMCRLRCRDPQPAALGLAVYSSAWHPSFNRDLLNWRTTCSVIRECEKR
jgi:hypothetical protein